jgi:hypothetical protein
MKPMLAVVLFCTAVLSYNAQRKAPYLAHTLELSEEIQPKPEAVNICEQLLRESSAHELAETFWQQANRTEEKYPYSKQDPIIIQNISGVESFAFCSIPKNGCSRWRRFLRRVQGVPDYMSSPHNRLTNGLMYPSDFPPTLFDRSISDPLLRIAIVRDPLSRLLSAWLEKVKSGTFPPGNCSNHLQAAQNFSEFVLCLEETVHNQNQGCAWNDHWVPQSCLCGLTEMRYDLLLQQENKEEWTKPVISCLGMERFSHNYTNGEDFGSSASNSMGSKSTGASSKLCGYYDAVTFAKARAIYARDDLFHTWDFSQCKSTSN